MKEKIFSVCEDSNGNPNSFKKLGYASDIFEVLMIVNNEIKNKNKFNAFLTYDQVLEIKNDIARDKECNKINNI